MYFCISSCKASCRFIFHRNLASTSKKLHFVKMQWHKHARTHQQFWNDDVITSLGSPSQFYTYQKSHNHKNVGGGHMNRESVFVLAGLNQFKYSLSETSGLRKNAGKKWSFTPSLTQGCPSSRRNTLNPVRRLWRLFSYNSLVSNGVKSRDEQLGIDSK